MFIVYLNGPKFRRGFLSQTGKNVTLEPDSPGIPLAPSAPARPC